MKDLNQNKLNLIYPIVRLWARIALHFFCREIIVSGKENVPANVPVILAANHPNSFFDAIILGVHYPRPMHFLARGDAFKKPLVAKLLRALKLIPIYRLSEGKENLTQNEATFHECISILKNNGAILIFSEGLCKNEWQLRPLKKGTARLAFRAWQEHGIEKMKVQPVGLTYNSFTLPLKTVWIKLAATIHKNVFEITDAGKFYSTFNEKLKKVLLENMAIKNSDSPIEIAPNRFKSLLKIIFALPALAGYIFQYWFYGLLYRFAKKKTVGTVFFDSVLFGLLMLIYPFFVLIVTLLAVIISGNSLCWLLLLFLPCTGWCYKMFKSL